MAPARTAIQLTRCRAEAAARQDELDVEVTSAKRALRDLAPEDKTPFGQQCALLMSFGCHSVRAQAMRRALPQALSAADAVYQDSAGLALDERMAYCDRFLGALKHDLAG